MVTIRPVPLDLRPPGTSFVARERELARLATALAAAAHGSPSLLLIAGEAGVGKTRLVQEFVTRVGDGAQVLLGRCIQLRGGGLPYGPIVDALRPLTRELSPGELDELFGPGQGDLTRLLPAATPPQLGRPAGPAGELARARLFEHVLRALDRLARHRPVVVVVEDVHWVDASTLDLLTFLVRMVRQERLLLVATYRSDELGPRHPLRATIAELERAHHVELIELARFDHEELTALLRGILGGPPSPAVVQRIFARSGGNAFLAEELLAAEASQPNRELPRRLQDLLLARISALAEDTRHALRVAATVGRPTEHHLLAAASRLPEARLHAALREAVDGQLLIAEQDAYGFRHALLQEAVYDELLPGERHQLHAAVARALSEDPHAGVFLQTAAELSHHWYAARQHPQALTASIAAGRVAVDVHGFTEAHTQYERALTLWAQVPDAHEQAGLALPELRLEAAEAARWAGLPDRATGLLQEALADLGSHLAPARAGLLHARLAECRSEAGDTKSALAAYEEASRLVANEPPSTEKARVLAGHGTELMRQGRYSASRALCEQAIAVARAVRAQAEEGRALNTLGCDLSALGDPQAGIAALRRALVLSEAAGSFDDLHRVYLNLSVVLELDAGRPQDGLEVARQGLERMRLLGLELALPSTTLRTNLAWGLWYLGHWEEAERLVSEIQARALPTMWALELQLLVGRLHMARGRLDLAHELGLSATRVVEQLDDARSEVFVQRYLADLAAWQGDHDIARSAAAEALQRLADTEDYMIELRLCLTGLRATADAAERARDRRARPSELTDIQTTGWQLLAHARQALAAFGGNLSEARANAAACEAEFTRLELRSDAEQWAAVATSWDALSRPYEAAYARWRQAEALLAGRASKAAAGVLRQAHQATVQLGERPLRHEIERLARRARIGLQPSGAGVKTTAATSRASEHGLTPREREVLQHLVEGRTNRQIARALFISEKTASVHVSNIMSKLGAANRSEAAAIAHRRRMVKPKGPDGR
jgi:DNA-binding CsgD family transcriptional regulator/tetratricopeptide (TPR) repeat protein